MAVTTNLKDLSAEVIDEYLMAAEACLDTKKPTGRILGYPATLLLFCVTDAIGHCLTKKGGDTRLGVLTHPHFGLNLTDRQIQHLAKWYRNLLAHNGLIAPGVLLTPDTEGQPFEFDQHAALTHIRVPVFQATVRRAWETLDKGVFNPTLPSDFKLPDPSARTPGFLGSSASFAASGMVFLSSQPPDKSAA